MNNLTKKEQEKVCSLMLWNYISFDTIGDDDWNDYCGQMSSLELEDLATDAVKKSQSNNQLLNEISLATGIIPSYLKTMTIKDEIVKHTAYNLAKENGIKILQTFQTYTFSEYCIKQEALNLINIDI